MCFKQKAKQLAFDLTLLLADVGGLLTRNIYLFSEATTLHFNILDGMNLNSLLSEIDQICPNLKRLYITMMTDNEGLEPDVNFRLPDSLLQRLEQFRIRKLFESDVDIRWTMDREGLENMGSVEFRNGCMVIEVSSSSLMNDKYQVYQSDP